LKDRTFLVGEQFTIADIATVPWVGAIDFYEGKDYLGYADFPNVEAWVQRCLARPGVQRGREVTPF
ncbi:MAG: glutathione binding-like protein, partial [Myxococcota bacterium]